MYSLASALGGRERERVERAAVAGGERKMVFVSANDHQEWSASSSFSASGQTQQER